MSATSTDPPQQDEATADAAIAHSLSTAQLSWRQGDRERAIDMLCTAAAAAPQAAKIWARLGIYALDVARNVDAHKWLQKALVYAPGDAASWTNLGIASLRLGHIDEAIAAYRRALTLDPVAISAYVNLGNALQQKGDVDGAVAALESALAHSPDARGVLNNLGNLYKEQGRFDDAFAAYEDARRAAPDFRPAFSNLLALTKLSARHSPEDIYALHRAFAQRFEAEWRADYVPATNAPDPERRLRIGYVSPDCHTALPAFLEPVLRCHDRARFEVFAYFNNPQPAEALRRLGRVTARFMKGAHDSTVAQWIRDDAIDVLIDIAGHTGHNRLGVFGRKPAPVQITWLDYLNTTGLDTIDYRLTDTVSDPPGASEALHSEALIRLAPTQWCWNPPAPYHVPRPLPLLAAGFPTLGSFNNGSKLTDTTLALWSSVLGAISTVRLVMVGVPYGTAHARVRAAFGANADRIRIVSRLDRDVFRREAAGIDIALDPHPFSGATTTLEMLWQGVPVVTWPGATSPSRSTASLLTTLGLDDWIARNADDYVALAKRAVAAPDTLQALRAELPGRLRASALCDAASFTRKLEDVLREAWRTWCARKGAPSTGTRGSLVPPSASSALRRIAGDAMLARSNAALRAGSTAGIHDACALLDEYPEWLPAQRAYLASLLLWSRGQADLVARMFPPPPDSSRRPRVSVIICSIDAQKFATVTASYRQRFAGYPLEIIGVHDARSLAEGYNRGAARSTGDLLVFSHDDIELVTTDFAPRLVTHFSHYDGIGVAGASRITGPHWGHAGQRFVHGHILHAPPRDRGGALLMASGFQQPVCEAFCGIDGVFIAVKRNVWETHRFDAEHYDGFHLYDIDFTWRASGAGARLAVPLDLLLLHRSTGRYDAAWRRYAMRFVAQAGLDPLAPPSPGGMQARLETLEQIDALRAAMLHFRFGALAGSEAQPGAELPGR